MFSPDGRQLAFVWINRQSSQQQIHVVDLSSGPSAAPRTVFESRASTQITIEDWSPDARLIAVNLDDGAGPVRQGAISVTDGAFHLLSETGRTRARILFAPAGQRLAMERPDSAGGTDIWIGSSHNRAEFLAATGPSEERLVGWSRDGRHLLYRSDRTGSAALWSVEVNTAGVGDVSLVSAQLGDFSPMGFDDSGNLYYRPRPPQNRTSILTLDPATTAVVTWLPDGGPAFLGPSSLPVWSPDGESIAYVLDQRGFGGRLRLVTRRVSTGETKELNPEIPDFGIGSGHLRWSPDGRTLLFIWDWSADGSQMYAIDIQTGVTKRVAGTDQWYSGSDLLPVRSVLRAWSRDNKLYFDRGLGNASKEMVLVEHDLATGSEREIFRGPDGWVHRLAVSPDAGMIYFKRPAGDGKTPPQDLVARDLRTGVERILVARQHFGDLILSPDGRALFFDMREDPAARERTFAVVPTAGGTLRMLPAMGMFYSWLPDGSGLIARSGGSGSESASYVFVPMDGSPARPIAALGKDPIGISMSPTGRYLAYTQWDANPAPGEIWRLDLRPPGAATGATRPPR